MKKTNEATARIRYLANGGAIISVPQDEIFMFVPNMATLEKLFKFDRCLRMTRKEAHKLVDGLDDATDAMKKCYHAAISSPTDEETDRKNNECAK